MPPETQHTQALYAEIAALHEQVQTLTREKQDLELLVEVVTEHSDHLQAELMDFNTQLEVRVRERTDELQSAYKTLEKMNENKSIFISLIAHELRTPLTVIKGNAQMLQSFVKDQGNDVMAHFLDGLIKGTERMESIVNSMLDVAKIENETLRMVRRPVHLWEITEPLQHVYRRILEHRQLTLTTDVEELPPILCDAQLLHRTFDELLSNAIKYTPNGGNISITGEVYSADAKQFLRVSIADTGIGIATEHHKLIFEKFYQLGKVEVHSSSRTNYKGGGPGLGLAVAKGIIEAHDGRIWVESSECNEETFPGSTFHILLPLEELDPKETT